MNDLRTAAQQALEALLTPSGAQACSTCQNGPENEYCCRREMWSAVDALRAALAQRAEPVQDQRCRAEPRSDGDFVCDCKIGACPGRSAALAQQAEPLNLRDPAVQKRLATQWGYVPAAAQAEPVEPVAWEASEDGRTIQDNDFTHDVVLRVVGDFEDNEQRVRYTQRIVDKLNAAAKAEPVACPCGDRRVDQCPGEWEPGCDLGSNAKYALAQQAEPVQEPVAWSGYDLDGMVEAFSRVIEAHYQRANPFQHPIDMDAQMALRILRGFIPAMKAYTAPPQRKQAEPAQEPITRLFGTLPVHDTQQALAQQAEPDHETRAELAEQQVVQLAEERDHYRNLWQKAQQAEPVEQLAELQAMLRAEVDRLIAAGIQPQRKPLTEEEIMHIGMTHQSLRQVVRAVERAHGIKEN